MIEVPFDIKPKRCPNPINLHARGVLAAAILGTTTFDVTTIDVGSILLEGPAGVVTPRNTFLEDVGTPFEPFLGKSNINDCNTLGPDGILDLVLHFDNEQVISSVLGPVDDGDVVVLWIKGKLSNGEDFLGEDVAIVVG